MAHQKKIITFSIVALTLLLLGGIAIAIIPNVISYFVHQKMALLPGNPSYPLWRDLDIPIYEKFYFFNVTNGKNVTELGHKPNFAEVGPFVFKTKLTKDIFNGSDASKLRFRENRQYFFVRHMSASDLDVTITTLNVPLAVAWQTLDFDKMSKLLVPIVKAILRGQNYLLDATIDELIFTGKKNMISCIGHIIDPKSQPDCLFAYFRGQNNTDDGLYEIDRGMNDPRRINSILSLNGSDHLNTWDGEQCNRITPATNGELFPTFNVLPEDKGLQMFRSDFCRVFNLTLAETDVQSDLLETLIVNRYKIQPDIFANSSINKANACFKPRKQLQLPPVESVDHKRLIDVLKQNDFAWEEIEDAIFNASADNDSPPSLQTDQYRERPSGVFDLAACKGGLPIFLSFPHFLHADPIYLSTLTGLTPNISSHESYIDVEPTTGTPVDFLARIQVNIDVDTSRSGAKMRSMMYPSLWQEFSIHITEEMANTIIYQTRTPRIIAFSVSSLMLAVGLASLFYSILLIIIEIHHRRGNKDEEPLLDDHDGTDINSIDNANN